MSVIVLWEDSAPRPTEFGPHNLLVACLADEAGEVVWNLKRESSVISLARRGNGNLLKQWLVWDGRAPGGEDVIAVFDDDRVRDLVSLPTDACRASVLGQLAPVGSQSARRVVLLERNIESLVFACDAESGLGATSEKDPQSRDRRLNNIAFAPGREKRDSVRRRVPSFGRLVGLVHSLRAK